MGGHAAIGTHTHTHKNTRKHTIILNAGGLDLDPEEWVAMQPYAHTHTHKHTHTFTHTIILIAGELNLDPEEWAAMRTKWEAHAREDLAVLQSRMEATRTDAHTKLRRTRQQLEGCKDAATRGVLMRLERTILCQVRAYAMTCEACLCG